jgi:hypothetical protein
MGDPIYMPPQNGILFVGKSKDSKLSSIPYTLPKMLNYKKETTPLDISDVHDD